MEVIRIKILVGIALNHSALYIIYHHSKSTIEECERTCKVGAKYSYSFFGSRLNGCSTLGHQIFPNQVKVLSLVFLEALVWEVLFSIRKFRLFCYFLSNTYFLSWIYFRS